MRLNVLITLYCGGNGKMIDRLLTRKNMIAFGLFSVFFHTVTSLLPWFIHADVADTLYFIDYVLLGLVGFVSVLFLAKQQGQVRLQPAQLMLILFMLWYFVSCLSMTIVYKHDWTQMNKLQLLNTAISLFLVFPLGYTLIRENRNTVGMVLIHIILLAWTLFITYILITVFQGKEIITPSNGVIVMKSSGLELNCNRNTTGSWEMLFFLGCIIMTLWSKKLVFKIIYGISSAIHYIALVLSNCRAGYLADFVAIMAIGGIAVYLWLDKRNKSHKLLIAIAAGLLTGAVYYFLSDIVFKLYYVATGTEASGRTFAAHEQTFSGREQVWQYSIQGIFSSVRCAIFGVTPASTPELISQISNGDITGLYTHNEFLEIAAGIGIPGLCIFLVWFYMIVRDTCKLYFVQKDRTLFLTVPVVIMALMAVNMMEAYLVFFDHIAGFVFFLLCGMLYGYVNEPIKTAHLSRQAARNRNRKQKK